MSPNSSKRCPVHPLKRAFTTRKFALQIAATKNKRRLKGTGVVLTAYKCRHCHSYHLTSQVQTK